MTQLGFHFDFVCPWCWMGWRRWKAAQALGAQAQIVWHGHQLLPQIPALGVDYNSFYLARLGGAANLAARRAQVAAAGAECGLGFRFEAIRLMPNTAAAHAWFAAVLEQAPERAEDVFEAIMHAWFMEGRDIGDPAVLRELCGVGQAADWRAGDTPHGAVPAYTRAGMPPLVGLHSATELAAYTR